MSNPVNFHPSEELLQGFACGRLTTGMNVAISAHVELCDSCREKTSELEAAATIEWLQSSPEPEPANGEDYSQLIADITRQPQTRELPAADNSVSEIHMLEHSVKLPKVLAKVASGGLVWKHLAGGINQASVTLDDSTQCEFLYMKPGSKVPVHRHSGNEVTLVLDGSFSDEMGIYKESDFVVRTKEHLHQPASEEGCLCFAVLDSPLTFTQGLARLLNPLLRYRFRRATSAGA